MSLIRAKDTQPEKLVRRLIHRMGYRYRLHSLRLPGKPDLVFAKLRKVIFVHGCFWHRHPKAKCPLARLPKSRLDFWVAKLEGNRQRDVKNVRRLRNMGWQVLTVWECQLNSVGVVTKKIRGFLDA